MSSTASNTIKTNIIDTVGTALTIGDATATSILLGSSTAGRTPTITIDTLSTLNNNTTPAIAIGTSSSTKTIKIGNNTNSVHCSSIDIQGSTINNITPSTGSISIGSSQTTGVLNLGGDSVVRTGAVNIASNANNSCNVNIANIGGSGASTTSGAVNIANGSAGFGLYTTSVGIGSGSTTGTVTIGNKDATSGGNSTLLKSGTVSIQNDATTAGTVNIKCGATSTGDINMKTGATSGGAVNIATGTGASQTTTVSISSGTTDGAIIIGSTSNITALKSNTIRIQNDASTAGTVNIKNNTSSSGDVNIKGGDTSSGAVNIAHGIGATQTTTVNIGSGSTTGTVTIGNSANSTSINSNSVTISSNTGATNLYGTTNVGRSTGTTPNTFIEIFSGSPNAIMDFHSGGVVNNDFDTRITSYGGSSSTDPALWNGKGLLELLGTTIQIAGTLVMKDSNNITLGNGSVAPTSGQLGYSFVTTLGAAATLGASGSTTSVLSASASIPVGTYMISYAIRINSLVASTIQNIQGGLSINGGNFYGSSILSGSFPVDTTVDANIGLTGTWIGQITSTQTPVVQVYGKWTGSNPQATTTGQGTSIMIVRIG